MFYNCLAILPPAGSCKIIKEMKMLIEDFFPILRTLSKKVFKLCKHAIHPHMEGNYLGYYSFYHNPLIN